MKYQICDSMRNTYGEKMAPYFWLFLEMRIGVEIEFQYLLLDTALLGGFFSFSLLHKILFFY